MNLLNFCIVLIIILVLLAYLKSVESMDFYKLLGNSIKNDVRSGRDGGYGFEMLKSTIHYAIKSDLKVFGTSSEYISIEIESTLVNYDINDTVESVYRPLGTDC